MTCNEEGLQGISRSSLRAAGPAQLGGIGHPDIFIMRDIFWILRSELTIPASHRLYPGSPKSWTPSSPISPLPVRPVGCTHHALHHRRAGSGQTGDLVVAHRFPAPSTGAGRVPSLSATDALLSRPSRSEYPHLRTSQTPGFAATTVRGQLPSHRTHSNLSPRYLAGNPLLPQAMITMRQLFKGQGKQSATDRNAGRPTTSCGWRSFSTKPCTVSATNCNSFVNPKSTVPFLPDSNREAPGGDPRFQVSTGTRVSHPHCHPDAPGRAWLQASCPHESGIA